MSEPIHLPCDLPNWGAIKTLLDSLKNNDGKIATLIKTLDSLYDSVMINFNPDKPKVTRRSFFNNLGRFLDSALKAEERKDFFNSLLPFIVDRILDIEHSRESLYYSTQQEATIVAISRGFASSLIACAFLCILPPPPASLRDSMSDTNFAYFFAAMSPTCAHQTQKLHSIINYFRRLRDNGLPPGKLVMVRDVLDDKSKISEEMLEKSDVTMAPVLIEPEIGIEESDPSLLQVNFGNSFLGGGVLRTGVLQEEIRFTVCPELLTSLFFMEAMDNTEAVFFFGYEQFSQFSGYSTTFRYTGNLDQDLSLNSQGFLPTSLVSLDAICFMWSKQEQFMMSNILREINKAFVGFRQSFTGISRQSSSHLDNCIWKPNYNEFARVLGVQCDKSTCTFEDRDETALSAYANNVVYNLFEDAYGEVGTGDHEHGIKVSMSSARRSSSGSYVSSSRRSSSRASSLHVSDNDELLQLNRSSILPAAIAEEDLDDMCFSKGDADFALPFMLSMPQDGCDVSLHKLLNAPISDNCKLSLSQEILHSPRRHSSPPIPRSRSPDSFRLRRESSPQCHSDPGPHRWERPLTDTDKLRNLSGFASALVKSVLKEASAEAAKRLKQAPSNISISPQCSINHNYKNLSLSQEDLRIFEQYLYDTPPRPQEVCRKKSLGGFRQRDLAVLGDQLVTSRFTQPYPSCLSHGSMLESMPNSISPALDSFCQNLSEQILDSVQRFFVNEKQGCFFDNQNENYYESGMSGSGDSPAVCPSPRQSSDRNLAPVSHRVFKFADQLSREILADAYTESVLYANIPTSQSSVLSDYTPRGVATGNWGCGAFGGDHQLKFMIQWIAVSLNKLPVMQYHTFKHAAMDDVWKVVNRIQEKGWKVKDVFKLITDFSVGALKEFESTESVQSKLFDHILTSG